MSPAAQSMIDAAVSLTRGYGGAFIAHLQAHDWKSVGLDIVQGELTLAKAAGVPGAGLALSLMPAVSYMVHHPADTNSPAMQKATGGEGGTNINTGA